MSDRASGKYSAESAKAAFQDGTAVIVRDHDKAGVFHSENVHPIDFDECTSIVPSDGELFGDYVFLLPSPKLYKLLSQSMDLPSEWPSLKDPIDTWFRDVPYVQSGSIGVWGR